MPFTGLIKCMTEEEVYHTRPGCCFVPSSVSDVMSEAGMLGKSFKYVRSQTFFCSSLVNSELK